MPLHSFHTPPFSTYPQSKAGLTDTMSLLTHEDHITVKEFASVPSLADLPEIQQEAGSNSNLSSLQEQQDTGASLDLAEGCFLTKSVKYTHQLVYWINAVHSGDPREVVSRKQIGGYFPQLLSVISFRNMSLNMTYELYHTSTSVLMTNVTLPIVSLKIVLGTTLSDL